MRRQTRLFQRGGDNGTHIPYQELRGGQVHGYGQVLRPSRGGPTRLPQDPRTDLVDKAQVLGNGNELQWRDKRTVFPRQAYQRLEADEPTLQHFKKRLVVQFET